MPKSRGAASSLVGLSMPAAWGRMFPLTLPPSERQEQIARDYPC